MAGDTLNEMQKYTYKEHLDRLGYFCQICGEEQRNAAGLVHFQSTESVQSVNICHDCLPEHFE
jgi:hypothetical protein